MAIETLSALICSSNLSACALSPSVLLGVESKLSGMETVRVDAYRVQSFFTSPKTKLRKVVLWSGTVQRDGLCGNDVLTIARSTGDLRKFECWGPKIRIQEMKKLAVANSRLANVSIRVMLTSF